MEQMGRTGWHRVTVSGSEVYSKSLEQKQLKPVSSVNQALLKLLKLKFVLLALPLAFVAKCQIYYFS